VVRLSTELEQLLHAHAPSRERADASRNRRRILQVADQLFAEYGPGNVSMDRIAEAAHVGKGTLYRRFKDQSGLALAVLEEKERRLQEAVIRGPAPLGPEAPADRRLIAFLHALIDLLEAHTELHILSETSSARYRSGLYAFYRLHVEILLRQIDHTLDETLMADLLLAPLSAELFQHLRQERGMSLERIKSAVEDLVHRVIVRT
jgi:AcrR family transcriptional regulator